MKVNNHPYIESYSIEELPNGVIQLVINCTQKEIYYHQYNDIKYLICGKKEEYDNVDENCIFDISRFLQREVALTYIRCDNLEKDQLSFYFIPFKFEWIKNRKFIIE